MKPKQSEKEYTIHYYEIDYKRRALPTTIINYFQDSAIFQSEQLGVGLDFLEENKLGWSLYQWDISITRYPVFGENVIVKTSPRFFDKFNAYRDFEMVDEKGETLVSAFTRWVLLGTEQMKLTVIPQEIYEAYGIDPDYKERSDLGKLKEPNVNTFEKEFTVRYSDIDTNKHVNNAKYIEWAIEMIPLETVLNKSLKNIKAMYKKAAKFGDNISVFVELEEAEKNIIGIHSIRDQNDKTLCLVETIWE